MIFAMTLSAGAGGLPAGMAAKKEQAQASGEVAWA